MTLLKQVATPTLSNPANPLVIPTRFRERILSHAVAFTVRRQARGFAAPQVLIIAGPPGVGKTRMATEVLRQCGAHVQTVSASLLGGEYEGQSATPLREAYIDCAMTKESAVSALLIDDFDLSAAGLDVNVSGTVNANLLNSLVMNLADNPFELRVSHADQPTRSMRLDRPPMILMTANDGGRIFGPLKRAGRTSIFEWVPTLEEKADMISGLYPGLSPRDVAGLVKAYPDEPIAFFEQLGLRAMNGVILDHLGQKGITDLNALDVPELISALQAGSSQQQRAHLAAAAKTLAAEIEGRDRSYL